LDISKKKAGAICAEYSKPEECIPQMESYAGLREKGLSKRSAMLEVRRIQTQDQLGLKDPEAAQVCALISSTEDCIRLMKEYEALLDDPGAADEPGAAEDRGAERALSEVAKLELARNVARDEKAAQDFLGLNLGLGLGVSFDLGSGDRIADAEVVDGIVRVTKEQNIVPRIVLEAHYFIRHNGRGEDFNLATRGNGPFVCVQSSGQNAIEGFGLGWMWGWRYKPGPPSSKSFNLAAGLIFDGNVTVLGDGLEANEPLPAGETAIRFKEESRLGALIFGSFSF
jgi:hypothetical protein